MARKKRRLRTIILCIAGVIILFVIILIVNLIVFEKNASVISKGQPIENYNEPNCALLVIDIQEATTGEISTNSFYTSNSDALINKINRVSDYCENQNIPIIFIRSAITNPLINLLNDSYAEGSPGAKFDKRLKLNSNLEIVKSKNDAFIDTKLDNILSNNKINELYIVGLDAAYCINSTVEAAQNRNYRVNLLDDAILSESVKTKDSMIVSFKNRGVNVLKFDRLRK